MSADDLRQVVRSMLLELDEKARSRVTISLLERAARSGASGRLAPVREDEVADAISFAQAAQRVGFAEPSDVDSYLARGVSAFLRKDYAVAHRIFGALLLPLGEGDIDVGAHEMLDEVLGTDTAQCAAQYVVSTYMISPLAERAKAVRAAVDEVQSIGYFGKLLDELERAAVEPLPGFDDFLPQWRALVELKPSSQRGPGSDWQKDMWLREVVQRLEGAEGLAKVARSTRRSNDLRAWCSSLVSALDWNSALCAFEEAAELVEDKERARAEFLDGAALAAQVLNREDLSGWLEKAWRACPTMLRLRRWLGASSSKLVLAKRVADALGVCPKQTERQRALLLVLQRDFAQAASLLAAAPGLGWSDDDHPGHLLFPLFARVLVGKQKLPSAMADSPPLRGWREEAEEMTGDQHAPRLVALEIKELLELAGIEAIPETAERPLILDAMKKAAERRLAGVTEHKRRGRYEHAAQLVATCIACDRTVEAVAWAEALKADYRRFPALRNELDRARSEL